MAPRSGFNEQLSRTGGNIGAVCESNRGAGAPSVLVAFGDADAHILAPSGIAGHFVPGAGRR
ncbi:MAG: hypothetical protein ACTHXV_09345 [Canibacter sp.]